jgi:lipopolysaccharide transport system ATP-binding protein
VIRAENLGKCYRRSAAGGGPSSYRTLRDDLADLARKPLAWLRGRRDAAADQCFWALDDVTFAVEPGEVLGIIGRNGAGKSTLLKVLTRVTRPTRGRAFVRGRVGSLLEVGTGFHPELTGRENVFLSGAVLGMSRAEVRRKFDDIVAFSEVADFLDTPVKRYSSGMYVRLAFAVAAHLEPEVLILDEVLAVGDAAFQRKCQAKMSAIAREGRTVLFVSHNMVAVEHLCTRGLLLRDGRVHKDGDAASVIAAYLAAVRNVAVGADHILGRSPDGALELLSLDLIDEATGEEGVVRCGRDIVVSLVVRSARPREGVTFLVALNNAYETRVSALNSTTAGYSLPLAEGLNVVRCRLGRFPLAPGGYLAEVKVLEGKVHLLSVPQAAEFVVEPGNFYGSGKFVADARWGGLCHMAQEWSCAAASGQHASLENPAEGVRCSDS